MNAAQMFLPTDLTTDEQQLVRTVTDQLLRHRKPTGSDQEQAVRQEATQVAAELIWQARAPRSAEDNEPESPPSGYQQRQASLQQMADDLADDERAELDRRHQAADPDA